MRETELGSLRIPRCPMALLVIGMFLYMPWIVQQANCDEWPVVRGNPASTAFSQDSLPAKPELLWEYKTDNEKAGFEATPVIADDRIFVGDFDSSLHAIDLKTGNRIWTKGAKAGFINSAAIHQGKVVAGDFDGQVYCFDAAKGDELWRRELDQPIASGANFFRDQVLISSEGGTLYAFDLNSGTPAWNYETGDQLRSSPTIWKTFTLLGGCDSRLHKINLNEGKADGNGVDLEGPTMSTPCVIGDLAIVPTQPGLIRAIHLESNKIVWTFSNNEVINDIRSSAACSGKQFGDSYQGIVVLTTRNRRVICLNLKDGSLVWETVLKKRTDGSPILCDGRAWIASADGQIYALDLATGSEQWSYQVSGQILASPVVANHRLIVATQKGSVLCFGKR